MKITEITATILTIVSIYLLSENLNEGFLVGAFGNLLWLYYSIKLELTGLAVVNSVILLINLHGLGVF